GDVRSRHSTTADKHTGDCGSPEGWPNGFWRLVAPVGTGQIAAALPWHRGKIRRAVRFPKVRRGMQTSIATVSLSGGLAEKLEATAAAGFTGVEIFESDMLSFNGTPKDVARMVAQLGLKIVTFQPFRDFE